MNKYIVKLRHMTLRRAVNKGISLIKEIPLTFSARNAKKVNTQLYEQAEKIAGEIPDSNGSAYYKKADIRIGIITDEFMYNYYKDAADLIVITPDNYREITGSGKIDLMMYISCWHGMAGDEWYGDIRHAKIPEVFRYANENGIITVFQSIEDPISYERFLPVAKESRYIFTTCKEKIRDYKHDTGNENVFLLEYGVNPHIHNPIGINYRKKRDYGRNTVFFAGSWMDIYKKRCRDMRLIFDGIIQSGTNLMIADRNTHVKLPGYKYPRPYQSFTTPPVEHLLLQKMHKLFDFNININTVQQSSTMCAMRVYELQALGCLMLSNYALSVSENFPGLFIINNKEEAGHILNGYTEKEMDRIRYENLRNVMSCCTVYDRLNYIFEKCGMKISFDERTVAVICRKKTDRIIEMFESQTYSSKKLLELCQLTPENYDFIAFFSEENSYGPEYLTDLINGFKYTDCDYVTKDPDAAGEEYDYTTGQSRFEMSVIKSSVFSRELTEGKHLTDCGFKIDCFQINQKQNISRGEKELAVIVPVYNNGRYLYDRCFRSLKRSSAFDKMRIYLIDDGSSDPETVSVIQSLCRDFDNVTSYFFADGGSGSAARPRNKGVEIAREKYVTYLDPDNEAINDGYARLLDKIKETDVDLAFGSIYTRTESSISRLGLLFKDTYIRNPRQCLIKENLRPQSVQGCVIRRSFIQEKGISNVEGAYGEDSLFFQEMMINAASAYYLNLPIHVYYAERSGSSVNTVGLSFFEKSLILEKQQVKRFREYGVLEEYITRRLDYFILNWYMDKLKHAGDHKEACLKIIGRIVSLYGKDIEEYESNQRF